METSYNKLITQVWKQGHGLKTASQDAPDLPPIDLQEHGVQRVDVANTNPQCFSSPMLGLSTSSDEDLDNDLRQGIDNIM